MKCLICNDGEVIAGKTQLILENNGTKVTVQGVPAMICKNCGDETVSEDVRAKLLKAVQEASTENA